MLGHASASSVRTNIGLLRQTSLLGPTLMHLVYVWWLNKQFPSMLKSLKLDMI